MEGTFAQHPEAPCRAPLRARFPHCLCHRIVAPVAMIGIAHYRIPLSKSTAFHPNPARTQAAADLAVLAAETCTDTAHGTAFIFTQSLQCSSSISVAQESSRLICSTVKMNVTNISIVHAQCTGKPRIGSQTSAPDGLVQREKDQV